MEAYSLSRGAPPHDQGAPRTTRAAAATAAAAPKRSNADAGLLSSPNRRKSVALAAAGYAATKEAVASFESLDEELERSKEQLALGCAQIAELEEELSDLRAARRSSLVVTGRSVSRHRKIAFNPEDDTPFAENEAGRKQKSRAIKAVERALLLQCAAPRGHAARSSVGDSASASVTKRKGIMRELFARMVSAEGGGIDLVVDQLPRTMRKHLRTLICIKVRLRRAFAVLKQCHGTEARENYYALCTAVAPEPVTEGDKRGMMRSVTSELDIPRGPDSVPVKQRAVRAAWDKLVGNSAPIAVGELVDCSQGNGTVEALHENGGISIHITGRGETVKFTSQGALLFSSASLSLLFSLPLSPPSPPAFNVVAFCVCRARPRGRAGEARRRLVAAA
jgi:hypothetical protein